MLGYQPNVFGNIKLNSLLPFFVSVVTKGVGTVIRLRAGRSRLRMMAQAKYFIFL